ncbi:plasmid mobilization relaxosome protein MobC [Actinopolyspora halophila]|uniref:plasmid mobilization relaxosome protein MobC n=1 Tax=Actinopolyspora halophila TaxID=1850 RepID=UPI000A2F5784|nr:plasmid mobilization relaxosome protein MobC [Actinopolyspora halophila]
MPRRRQRDGVPRPNRITVRLSDTEWETIAARAAVQQQAMSAYIAERSQEPLQPPGEASGGGGLTPAQLRGLTAELYALKRILDNAGNNLNQLTKAANATGEVQAEALHHADRISRTLPRLDAFVSSLRKWVDT